MLFCFLNVIKFVYKRISEDFGYVVSETHLLPKLSLIHCQAFFLHIPVRWREVASMTWARRTLAMS